MSYNLKERGKKSFAKTYTLKKWNISRVEWQQAPVESQLRSDKSLAAFRWLKETNATYRQWFPVVSWNPHMLS